MDSTAAAPLSPEVLAAAAQLGSVNLREFAELTRRSEPYLRKVIDKHADFPCTRKGDKGVDYEIDPVAGRAFLETLDRGQADAAAARSSARALLQRELFGEGLEPDLDTLTPTERRLGAEARIAENKLAESQGLLLRADQVETMVAAAFAKLRQDLSGLGDAVARDLGLDRAQRNRVDAKVRQALAAAAAGLQALAADYDLDDDERGAA